jgi:hypothetical protein
MQNHDEKDIQEDMPELRICSKCKSLVNKLYGLMVPHLCKQCYDKMVQYQEQVDYRCSLCKQIYAKCCC